MEKYSRLTEEMISWSSSASCRAVCASRRARWKRSRVSCFSSVLTKIPSKNSGDPSARRDRPPVVWNQW